MSATPKTRGEFFRAMQSLIRVFERSATIDSRTVLARMDAELRYGDEPVFAHLYARYLHWQQQQTIDSAAVRLAEGEFFNDVQHALNHRITVAEAQPRPRRTGDE